MFAGVMVILLACAIVFTCGSVLGSYIIIPFLYNSQVVEAASKLFWIANAGQVFFFLSNTMMVVVLRFATEKYQIYIGTILYRIVCCDYCTIYACVGTLGNGNWTFAY